MGFFDFIKNNKNNKEEIKVVKEIDSGFGAFEFGENYNKEVFRINRGYTLGESGSFSDELNSLYQLSPLHSAIVNIKKLLTVGNGYTINDAKDAKSKIAINQLKFQVDEILEDMCLDLFIHSKIFLLITWNSDNTKIIKIERLSPEMVNINEIDNHMQPINFLVNYDWSRVGYFKTTKYPIFDKTNLNQKKQIYFYDLKSPGQKLISKPSYFSSLKWIKLDAAMADFHEANINNSVNPSILIKYFEKPGTKEERQSILYDINNSFAGRKKTARAMVTFSNGRDLSPEITQMEANKLDKTFLALTDTIQRQICYAHNIDAQLLGLKTPGSLGESGTFEYSFQLFKRGIIDTTQRKIENIINEFFETNGLIVDFKLNEVEIVNNSETKTSISGAPVEDVEMTEEEEKIIVNENVKNLTAKQHQQLLRIIREFSKEKLSENQARILLKTSLGFNDEEINEILGI